MTDTSAGDRMVIVVIIVDRQSMQCGRYRVNEFDEQTRTESENV